MTNLLAISLGSICGALLRYGLSVSTVKLIDSPFPWGTLAANVIGCFLMGFLIGSGKGTEHETLRLGFGVGFLGSLTTFSTFSAESVNHALEGNWGIASANVLVNVVVCLAAVMVGILLARKAFS